MTLTLRTTADVVHIFATTRGALVERAKVIVVVARSFVGRQRINRADESGAVAGFLKVAAICSRPTHDRVRRYAAPLAASAGARFAGGTGIAVVAAAAQVIELTQAGPVTGIRAAALHGACAAASAARQQMIAGVGKSFVQLFDLGRTQLMIEGVYFVDPPDEGALEVDAAVTQSQVEQAKVRRKSGTCRLPVEVKVCAASVERQCEVVPFTRIHWASDGYRLRRRPPIEHELRSFQSNLDSRRLRKRLDGHQRRGLRRLRIEPEVHGELWLGVKRQGRIQSGRLRRTGKVESAAEVPRRVGSSTKEVGRL
jgi:hypothetical protein